jgi:GET complex subunit GET2
MLALFQSLLNPEASGNPDAQIPSALASLLNGGALPPGFEQQQEANAEAVQRYSLSTSTWRLVHFLCALALSVFALRSSPARFNGSETSRVVSGVTGELGSQLFMYFGAVEAVLLSSRLFLESGKPLDGMLGTVVNILPSHIGGWINVLVRYGKMGSSVVQDALVVVWVIGMVGWYNGLAVV